MKSSCAWLRLSPGAWKSEKVVVATIVTPSRQTGLERGMGSSANRFHAPFHAESAKLHHFVNGVEARAGAPISCGLQKNIGVSRVLRAVPPGHQIPGALQD